MKKLLIVLVALGLLLAIVTVAQAQEPYWIVLWQADGGVFTVPPGYIPNIGIGWTACNKGLTQAFINATNIELTLDGELLYQSTSKHDPFWWDIWTWEEPVSEDCFPDPNSKQSSAYWIYPLELTPGEYEVSYSVWTDHQITDGFDGLDGIYDGLPDFYNILNEGTLTLIIQ